MKTVAVFVTAHGFGHAARACAVIETLIRTRRPLHVHIFTTVPRWFFDQSLSGGFSYHTCSTDVGLIQVSPLEEDFEATLRALEVAPWRDDEAVGSLARRLEELDCSLVVVDISPLGLVVARRAGLPSVVIENFTWDWIYSGIDCAAELAGYCDELSSIYATADLRIQTRPVCRRLEHAVEVGPVARAPRHSRRETRQRLGIPEDDSIVLASMGGLGWKDPPLDALRSVSDLWMVVPGGAETESRHQRLVLLPFRSSHYHPDLVRAADVVVGKLGYSTVAEAVHGGTAFAYVERKRFPESPTLARFVEQNLAAMRIPARELEVGTWLPAVRKLAARHQSRPDVENGAVQAADAIAERFPDIFK